MAKHTILGGKVHVYQRDNSRFWQCSTFLVGRNRRTSTKEESLSQAKDFAEDWYLELRGKHRDGQLHNEKTFADVAKQFMAEYEVLTEGERNERWVQGHYSRIRMYLNPYFGKMALSQITAGVVQEYRVSRMTKEDGKKLPSRSTLHHETVTLRQVLKTGVRHGWLKHLPDISTPYRASTKVVHRAWFSPEEYKQLYTAMVLSRLRSDLTIDLSCLSFKSQGAFSS